MRRYDSYKDSGVEWIGEIPSHWKKGKLKHYFNLSSGKNPSDFDKDLGGFPVYGSNGIIGYTNNPDLLKETILIGRVGSSGELNLNQYPCSVSDNCLIVDLIGDTDLKFVYYLLLKSELKNYTTKTSQPLITGSTIREIETVILPYNEQEQIVSFLDIKTSLIDSLIEKTQLKIELLKENRTSLINEVVTKGLNPNVEMKDSGVEWIGEIPSGWVNGRLGYYSNVFRGSGYQYLNQVEDDFEGEKEKVVRISDITDFNPIWFEYQEQFENYRIKPDNILIGGTGHYFGKSIYVTKEMEGLIHSYNIIRVVIKNQYPKYVQYWLSSSNIREQMDISVLGSGQPFIDIQGLKDLQILIPPLSEQLQIVEYLDEHTQLIDKTISVEERRIELLKEYRQSLISEVVTGKRKVVTYE
jgi:type I restriction enzyme S subunit